MAIQRNPAVQMSTNKWMGRIIPIVLIGVVGYVTWVVVALISVNYLINPPIPLPRQKGAAIAVLIIYFILLSYMASTYFRLVQVVLTDPGLVPRGPSQIGQLDEKSTQTSDKTSMALPEQQQYLDRGAVTNARSTPPPGLAAFYSRDVFECEVDGLPRWCSSCKIWKPDRSHHSSEMDRCVYKMDHYCPWAAGMISETSFKFFIQFCAGAAVFCTFVLIAVAYFLAQRRKRADGAIYSSWIVAIALASLFLIFSGGIAFNSLRFAFTNSTTVESLSPNTRIHQLAVLIPPSYFQSHPVDPSTHAVSSPFLIITYPLGSTPNSSTGSTRSFAVLQTPPGSNPYKLSSLDANFKTVFGNHWSEWFLPIRRSPCCKHRQANQIDGESIGTSMYSLGPLVEQLKRDAGLVPGVPAQNATVVAPDAATRHHQVQQMRHEHSENQLTGCKEIITIATQGNRARRK